MKDNIKTAEEFYRDYVDFEFIPFKEYDANTIINDSVLAMKEYAKQFIDLAADRVTLFADLSKLEDTEELLDLLINGDIKINKESILSLKQLIK